MLFLRPAFFCDYFINPTGVFAENYLFTAKIAEFFWRDKLPDTSIRIKKSKTVPVKCYPCVANDERRKQYPGVLGHVITRWP